MGVYQTASGKWAYSLQRNGKRIRVTVGSRAEAEAAFASAISSYDEGSVTLYAWMGEVIRRSAGLRSRNTILSYVNSMTMIMRILPDVALDALKRDKVHMYIKERSAEVSNASVNREINFLSRCYTMARAEGLAHHNPTSGLNLIENNKRIRYLAAEEIKNLLDVCSDPLLGIVEVALFTGMRRNEILGLRWSDIDGSAVHIRRKWGRGNTQVQRLPSKALAAINRQPKVGEKVFPVSVVRRSFGTAVRRAGLEDVTFHTLRHTFASQAVMAGMPLRVLQEVLGHRRLDMVLRYAHLGESHVADILERVAVIMDKSVKASRNASGPDKAK